MEGEEVLHSSYYLFCIAQLCISLLFGLHRTRLRLCVAIAATTSREHSAVEKLAEIGEEVLVFARSKCE